MGALRLPESPSPPTGTAPSTAPTAPVSPARGGRSAITTEPETRYRGRGLSQGWLHGLAVFDDRRAHAGVALRSHGRRQDVHDRRRRAGHPGRHRPAGVFSHLGHMIGFDLNTPVSAGADGGVDGGTGAGADGGADAGAIDKGNYDAVAHGITGFAFDIEGSFSRLRVEFATEGTWYDPAYWQGATMDFSPVRTPGHYEIRWAEVGGPKLPRVAAAVRSEQASSGQVSRHERHAPDHALQLLHQERRDADRSLIGARRDHGSSQVGSGARVAPVAAA